MHQVFSAFVGALRLGAAQSHRDLTILPLLSERHGALPYISLEEALEGELLEITELHHGGDVNKLRALNKGSSRVFIFDGEALIGAKQNRISNASYMVAADSQVVLPVSCIERGRWAYQSSSFSCSAEHVYAAGARSARLDGCSLSLAEGRGFTPEQSQVWAQCDSYLSDTGVYSPTTSFAEIGERFGEQLEGFSEAFTPLPEQLGAMALISGQVVAVDAFSSPETLVRALPKLVRSYAMDTLGAAMQSQGSGLTPGDFLQLLQSSPSQTFDSVGEGYDLRISSEHISASALVVEGEVIHLSAFPHRPEGELSQAPRS